MRSAISQTLHLLNRRSRSGQSIVIIALGFIGLVAFVGLATDTAVLFVRYSTLHRAVDAAAIAAAGAARQSSSFASLGAVAEEYIKIHGLDPLSVKVEDCATEMDDYVTKNGGTPANAFTQLVKTPGEQLCTEKPEKLVRVDAQIDSQTTFLSLIGFPTVRLSASSVSQTASLDVALLIDTSYSESYDTKGGIETSATPTTQTGIICQFDTVSCNTSTYSATQLSTVSSQLDSFESLRGYFGDQLDPYDPANPSGAATAAHPKGSIRAECRQIANITGSFAAPAPTAIQTAYSQVGANYYYGGCCDEPVTFSSPGAGQDALDWYIYSDSTQFSLPQYNTFNIAHLASGQSPMDGGSHSYANRNFSTLVCKPFKYVRDAARDFLNHFDFTGGDRAMLVTFDDSVHELTVNGEYNNPDDPTNGAIPVFADKSSAIIALNKYAGVQIAPSGSNADCLAQYYPPYNTNGHYYQGTQTVSDTGRTWLYETISTCADTNTGGAVLAGQSLLTNAQWIRRDSVWVMVILSDGYPNRTPGLNAICVAPGNPSPAYQQCGPAINGGQSASIHEINASGDPHYGTTAFGDPTYMGLPAHNGNFFGNSAFPWPPSTTAWDGGSQPISTLTKSALRDPGFCPWNTFCDPSAGGSNNAGGTSAGTYPLVWPDPNANFYYPDGHTYPNPESNTAPNTPGVPDATGNTPNVVAYNTQYCPASDSEQNPIWWSADSKNPYRFNPSDPRGQYNSNQNNGSDKVLCTSTNPDARHFCMDPTSGVIDPQVTSGGAIPNPSNPSLCSTHYDAADYTRDMVDFAALTDYTSTVKGNSVAMYGIFFPHQTNSTNGDIGSYILGAKLMRYVADAGDNGTLDNHVQNWYRQHIVGPASYQTDPVPPSYDGSNTTYYPNTPEDPCATYDFREKNVAPGSRSAGPVPNYPLGNLYEDLYRYNCGNYYFAGSTAAVDQAFLSIASRLYTRLAH